MGLRKLIVLAALALGSCAHIPWNDGVPAEEARGSVYKVKVTLTVDASSIGGPTDAEVGWSGTAWVAERDRGRSFLMTAGHVCESAETFTYRYLDWTTFEVQTVELPISKVEHNLIGYDGTVFHSAEVILDEDLDGDFSGHDMCMLSIGGDLGTALPLADEDPPYASMSEVIGAPKGLWGGGVAVTANLKFSGRGQVFGDGNDALAFTGEAAPGNSGSAIMYDGYVVALLNLGATKFPSLSTGIPHEVLRDFIRRARHRTSG